MELDDELCLCFHVTQRKVINYLRIERPKHVAQLSECYGAGTGGSAMRRQAFTVVTNARVGGLSHQTAGGDCIRTEPWSFARVSM